MSNEIQLFFEVFTTKNDHYSWEKHIEYAEKNQDFDYLTKERLVDALRFLQSELGPGFLRIRKDNPLYRKIIEKGTWRAFELIAFVETLRHLKSANSNYSKLLEKMASPSKCAKEGIPFTEISETYLKQGMSLWFSDEVQGQKNPDIVVNHVNGDRFLIEVSKLEDSLERRTLKGNYDELMALLEFDGNYLPYSCNQLQFIPPEEMDNVLKVIQETKVRAVETGQIVHYTDSFIRLSMAPLNKFDELMQWIEANDFRKGLLGAPLNFDESKRIADYKIDIKAWQIPSYETGLLYILVEPLYFCLGEFIDSLPAFEQKFKDYPHLLGTVMYGSIIDGSTPSSIHHNGHFYGVKKLFGVVSRHLLFVRSPFYKGGLKDRTIEDIYKTFE